jgi:hypothetical protein
VCAVLSALDAEGAAPKNALTLLEMLR